MAGTTDAGPDGRSRHPGDAAAQARAAFEIVGRALEEGGFSLADVVRTRMFVVDIAASSAAIGRVHGEVFGAIRPAATMVEVPALIDPSLLVEIEAEARRSRGPTRPGQRRLGDPQLSSAGDEHDRRDDPQEQALSPRDEGKADEHRDPLEPDVE